MTKSEGSRSQAPKAIQLTECINVHKEEYKDHDDLTKAVILTKSDIEESAFEGCTSLRLLNLDVKNIGKNAFKDCRSISDCMLEKVESISEDAFKNCTGIKDLRLGNKITEIGKHAFEGCHPVMILCSQDIFDKYLSNENHKLDMKYLFGDRDITSHYTIDNSYLDLFLVHYDVAIVEKL